MSNPEFVYWRAYYNEKARLEAEANNPKKNKSGNNAIVKKSMGNNQTSMDAGIS